MSKTQRLVCAATWLIGAGFLSVSTSGAQPFLHAHGFALWASWVLPACVDLGLAVALVADQALAADDEPVRWGTVLRWATAAATLLMNVLSPLMAGHWMTAAAHAMAPGMLFVVMEAATSYQRRLAKGTADRAVPESWTDEDETPACGRPVDPMLPVVVNVVRGLADEGTRPSRDRVRDRLKANGHKVATTRLTELLRVARREEVLA